MRRASVTDSPDADKVMKSLVALDDDGDAEDGGTPNAVLRFFHGATRMADCRTYRNPDELYTGADRLTAADLRAGYWSELTRIGMDARFQEAMTSAIASGAEQAATGTSTHYGTKLPRVGYERSTMMCCRS